MQANLDAGGEFDARASKARDPEIASNFAEVRIDHCAVENDGMAASNSAGRAIDPLLWPKRRKWIITILVCIDYFMFTWITTAVVSNTVTAALQTKLNATYVQIAQYSVAIPALGLAISPLFWTPLAKTYGRRPVMIIGVLIAFVSCIGAAVTSTYGGYMTARFFQGWGVGPASTVGLQILEDIWDSSERGQKVGYWTISIDLGLLFGPLIGSFAALVSADFVAWLSAIIFGVLLCLMLLFLDETAYLRVVKDDNSDPAVTDSLSLPWLNLWVTDVHGLERTSMLETIRHVIKLMSYPNVAIPVILYSWTWYLWIMCVITMLPVAYPTWRPEIQGLLVTGMILGTIIAEFTLSGTLSDRLVHRLSGGVTLQRRPEMRLWLVIPAVLTTVIGLALFGGSTQRGWHWAISQLGAGLVAFGIQSGNTALSTYVVDCYPEHVMSIIAFYSVHLNLSAFASPFWIVPQVTKWGWGWSFGSEAIIVTVFAILFVPCLLIFGGKLRAWRGPLVWKPMSINN
ncbi:MFS general substrate transporter [Clavulina sp. PMI_390]|nr:MFS general substrate transporter [Clavulina sp. PMI_390]